MLVKEISSKAIYGKKPINQLSTLLK